jgi:predicted DNA-binding transcriptional regulator YafY
MTARALAHELEVNKRTIYRDVDALCAAGVPVYADPGPGGGYALLDSYRTTLTGLNTDEVRALFMLSIPAPLAQLGVGQELKAALLKLVAALPGPRRQEEERVRQRIHLDAVAWTQPAEPVPHLQALQEAVWQDRKLSITYRLPFAGPVEVLVEPLGLVAKAALWYLVAARREQVRAYRVSRLMDARLTEETFARPADFDLAAFWEGWCRDVEARRQSYLVTVRVAPALVPLVVREFPLGEKLDGRPDAAGWLTLTLPFEGLEDARTRLLPLGGDIEVLAPRALRLSLADFARQIAARYER